MSDSSHQFTPVVLCFLSVTNQSISIFSNCLIKAKAIPSILKEGLLTPIYKKGDPTNPGNYRGITVTPVLLKVLEHILNTRHNKISKTTQS